MKLIVALLLVASSFGAIAEENTFRQLGQSEANGVRIVSGTNLPAETVRQTSPIMVYNSTFQGPAVDMIKPGLVKAFQEDGYTMFDAKGIVNDLQKEKKNLRVSSFYIKSIFLGTWDDFLAANAASVDQKEGGREFNPSGVMTTAVNVLVFGVSLLAGAPVNSVVIAGMGANYGSFSREEERWIQSIQVDPSWTANPPAKVLLLKTNVTTNQDKDTSSLWTLVMFSDKANLGNKAVSQSVVNGIHNAVNKIAKMKGSVTPEESQILDSLSGLRASN